MLTSFRLHGVLGDRPVSARWTSRSGLACSPSLRTQAQLLVDLGELFETGSLDVVVPASLDTGGEAVLLTLLRSCDRVVELDAWMAAGLARSDPVRG